jgi:preprotein translocase subunit SecF
MTFFIKGGLADDLSKGVNAGIDFTGGTILTVRLGNDEIDNNRDFHEERVRSVVETAGGSVTYVQKATGTASENSALEFRYQNIGNTDAEADLKNKEIRNAVEALYYPEGGTPVNFITYSAISATASQSLINKTILAVAISMVLILIYIVIRFEPMSAIAAIVALIHDIAMVFAITAITGLQINSSFVAAIITIISYSINNTIIIFDRVREIKKPYGKKARFNYEEVGDQAIRSTVNRSIYTTLTTLFAIVILAIIGVPAIREFTLPIIIGLLVGLYSSLVVATPLWCLLMRWAENFSIKRERKNNPAYVAADGDVNIVKTQSGYVAVKSKDEKDVADGEAVAPKSKAKKPEYKHISYKSKKNTKFKK